MITQNPEVKHYTTVSPIGKPIIDLFDVDYCQSCIATIQILQYYKHWNFNLCSALKYLWRLGQKTEDIKSDLIKAIDYLTWARDDELNDLPGTVSKLDLNIAIAECRKLYKCIK